MIITEVPVEPENAGFRIEGDTALRYGFAGAGKIARCVRRIDACVFRIGVRFVINRAVSALERGAADKHFVAPRDIFGAPPFAGTDRFQRGAAAEHLRHIRDGRCIKRREIQSGQGFAPAEHPVHVDNLRGVKSGYIDRFQRIAVLKHSVHILGA